MYKIKDQNGTIIYYNSKNKIHRDDGPAVEYANGTKEWARDGRFYRARGPAIEDSDGTKRWYDECGEWIKTCHPKTVSYIKNKGTENEEEMELELCCKECAEFYYGISYSEFELLKNGR